jgi:hypothetical protein
LVTAVIELVPDLTINPIQSSSFLIQALFYLFKVLSVFTQQLIWAAVLFGLSLLLWWWSRHRAVARWLLPAALGWTALVGWLQTQYSGNATPKAIKFNI